MVIKEAKLFGFIRSYWHNDLVEKNRALLMNQLSIDLRNSVVLDFRTISNLIPDKYLAIT